MKLSTRFLLVLTVAFTIVFNACVMAPNNHRGDDCGPTRGPLSNTSQDLEDLPSNPSRW